MVAAAGFDANGDGNVVLLTVLKHPLVIRFRAADGVCRLCFGADSTILVKCAYKAEKNKGNIANSTWE